MNRIKTLTVRVSPGVLHQSVGEETVLLHPEGATYFGLDAVGSRIWQLLADGDGFAEVVDTLLEEFDVERHVLEADVERLVGELVEAGLLVPK